MENSLRKLWVLLFAALMTVNAGAADKKTWSRKLSAFCESSLKLLDPRLPAAPAGRKRLPPGMTDLQEIKKTVEANLGLKLVLTWGVKHFPLAEVDGERVKVSDEGGREIGEFNYYFYADGTLYLASTDVEKPYRGNGVSELIFAGIMVRHPKVTRYSGLFVEDNRAAVDDALLAGAPCEEAVKATPFYKMLARFGYTKLISYNCAILPAIVVEHVSAGDGN